MRRDRQQASSTKPDANFFGSTAVDPYSFGELTDVALYSFGELTDVAPYSFGEFTVIGLCILIFSELTKSFCIMPLDGFDLLHRGGIFGII